MSSSELSKDQTFILKPAQEMVRNHYSMSSQRIDMVHPHPHIHTIDSGVLQPLSAPSSSRNWGSELVHVTDTLQEEDNQQERWESWTPKVA